MQFLIILVLTIISGYVLPWWAAAVMAFLVTLYFGKTSAQAFSAGFGGLFCGWLILALIKSLPNNNKLADRVAHLFHLPNWIFVLAVTAIIGGFIGGMAAWSGMLVRKAFQKNEVEP
ncbi:hypothetical protein [Mucilaginibacter sp. UYCu711]|uniref:hypothetical protein n=1 Tax=Mucilaginibacter sp. UYCu711 TaxID=3156339 RepID=UPI003D228064